MKSSADRYDDFREIKLEGDKISYRQCPFYESGKCLHLIFDDPSGGNPSCNKESHSKILKNEVSSIEEDEDKKSKLEEMIPGQFLQEQVNKTKAEIDLLKSLPGKEDRARKAKEKLERIRKDPQKALNEMYDETQANQFSSMADIKRLMRIVPKG